MWPWHPEQETKRPSLEDIAQVTNWLFDLNEEALDFMRCLYFYICTVFEAAIPAPCDLHDV